MHVLAFWLKRAFEFLMHSTLLFSILEDPGWHMPTECQYWDSLHDTDELTLYLFPLPLHGVCAIWDWAFGVFMRLHFGGAFVHY